MNKSASLSMNSEQLNVFLKSAQGCTLHKTKDYVAYDDGLHLIGFRKVEEFEKGLRARNVQTNWANALRIENINMACIATGKEAMDMSARAPFEDLYDESNLYGIAYKVYTEVSEQNRQNILDVAEIVGNPGYLGKCQKIKQAYDMTIQEIMLEEENSPSFLDYFFVKIDFFEN